MAKHNAIYMRVSTRNQDLASQEPDLKRWAEAQDLPAVWYSDTFTGKTMNRPGWNQLMADVHAGRVASVVVWRLDRAGRTSLGLLQLFNDLRERKVGFVSIRDSLDLGTSTGRWFATLLAGCCQYETEIRSERVAAGLEAARARGQKLGPAFGSRAGKRLKITPEQIAVTHQLKAGGKSISAVARLLKLSRPSIYSILAEPPCPAGR